MTDGLPSSVDVLPRIDHYLSDAADGWHFYGYADYMTSKPLSLYFVG